jgi:hypothetical protein
MPASVNSRHGRGPVLKRQTPKSLPDAAPQPKKSTGNPVCRAGLSQFDIAHGKPFAPGFDINVAVGHI